MGCCCNKNKNRKKWTKTVTLTFFRCELLHDIGNIAYVEADVMKTNDEHDRHQVFDIVQDGNVERVTRVLDLAFAAIDEFCYPYTKVNITDGASANDMYDEAYSYNIEMRVPDDFSETTFRLMKELIHELLVCSVLADWLSITKPEAEANWQRKIEGLKDRIKGVLFARGGRTRRTLSPF